jgi:hypothetical protein
MGSHPINLLFRFILELTAFLALGTWGWRQSEGWPRFVLAVGVPLIAAAIWGTFAVANDPSRSGSAPIPVPGILRLVIEFSIFAVACWALFDMDARAIAWTLGVATAAHYALSYDRIVWLLSQ